MDDDFVKIEIISSQENNQQDSNRNFELSFKPELSFKSEDDSSRNFESKLSFESKIVGRKDDETAVQGSDRTFRNFESKVKDDLLSFKSDIGLQGRFEKSAANRNIESKLSAKGRYMINHRSGSSFIYN